MFLGSTEIVIIKEDITKCDVDAIVNAANSTLLGGGGVDGAIHKAGGEEILKECIEIRKKQGGCKTGQAVITKAGNLKAKFVIHTVGHVWNGGNNNEEKLLESCYSESLKLAIKNYIKTIAFPNISTGVYRFPKELAAHISLKTVKEFIEVNQGIDKIIFVCFDDVNYKLYLSLLK